MRSAEEMRKNEELDPENFYLDQQTDTRLKLKSNNKQIGRLAVKWSLIHLILVHQNQTIIGHSLGNFKNVNFQFWL